MCLLIGVQNTGLKSMHETTRVTWAMVGGHVQLRPLDDGTWNLMVIKYRSRQAAIISKKQYTSLILVLMGEGLSRDYEVVAGIGLDGLHTLLIEDTRESCAIPTCKTRKEAVEALGRPNLTDKERSAIKMLYFHLLYGSDEDVK
jgi:hypothetical protein